jgi:uncharacterized membrane protein YvbJ
MKPTQKVQAHRTKITQEIKNQRNKRQIKRKMMILTSLVWIVWELLNLKIMTIIRNFR